MDDAPLIGWHRLQGDSLARGRHLLRNTLGRIATLEMASSLGKVPLDRLLTDLLLAFGVLAVALAQPDISLTAGSAITVTVNGVTSGIPAVGCDFAHTNTGLPCALYSKTI